MQMHYYTLILAHDPRGRIRKIRIPRVLVHLILVAAAVGVGAIAAGVASYSHMLMAVSDYQQVRTEREQLRAQNQALHSTYSQTQQRLDSLESLANEIAASYGLIRLRQTPFGTLENASQPLVESNDFRDTLARYRFLRHHATAVTLYASGVRPVAGQDVTQLNYTPSLWPVRGRLISSFGSRLDPFNGEGSFHRGVDISTRYGSSVRAAADGFVVAVGRRPAYGRVVAVDHGGGITTWYAHLSKFRAYRGQAVQRGDILGYSGTSGRSTGPHLHYEVRLWDAPLNPWRFLRGGRTIRTARARPLTVRGGDD
jgi:murein DD-endopeptidase MepM/ murein hydrolase activator NlpD